MKVLCFVFLLINFSLAFEYHFGSCPSVSTVSRKSMTQLTGRWFDAMRYTTVFIKGKCLTFEVVLTSNTTVTIISSEIKDGEPLIASREASLDSDGGLEFKFTFLKFTIKFFVLDADDEEYLVGFTCKSIARMMNMQMAWIWSRHQNISDENLEKAPNVLKTNEISTDELNFIDQSECY